MSDDILIIPIDSQHEDPCLVMVFELYACSVYQLLRRGEYSDGLPFDTILKIIHQTAQGIKALHDMNIVHTDLKPENILIKGKERKISLIIDEINKLNISEMYIQICSIEKQKIGNSSNKNKIKQSKIDTNLLIKNKVIEIMDNIINIVNKQLQNSNNSNNSDDSDNSNDSDIKNIIDFDINNIQVVLADFGTIFNKNDIDQTDVIQTRYYRAPEVILQCGTNEKCDLWSLGCLIYEILTGDILFDPDSDKDYSNDFHHIYWFYQICGDIPNWMICKSLKKNEFFNKHNKFIIKKPDLWSINDVINDHLNINKYNTSEINKLDKILNIINNLLKIDPNKRLSLNNLIVCC